MKQKLQNLTVALTLLLLCIPLQMYAQSTRTVNQPQFGKQTITVASGEEITFYDWKGTDNISSNSSNNAHSMTVFKPAEPGMSIQITFSELEIKNDGSSWPGKVQVYDGEADADNSITWATTTGGVQANSPLPTENILATFDGSYANQTFVSSTTDGALSVAVLWKYAKASKGWTATVKAVKLEDMTITGAGSSYTNVVASPKSKMNIPFATAYVTATGVLNAEKLTSVSFKMTQNESAVNPLELKLYAGDGSNIKGATPLEATAAADGDGYTFTLTHALSEGTNNFTIAGDLLGTAEIGAKAEVAITKVTTTNHTSGVSPFTSGTPVTVVNPAIVLMSSTAQTITVGETPLSFFDEGGADDGIVSKTNGQITFLSGVAGKKVMVNFTTNNIWHGSLYNQELRIYNGTEVNAANLIKTLQQGETGLIRSTADDGALTVVLFSDASNSIAADGWEATVSLFTPQAMTLNTITVNHPTTETVVAGDENQQILSFNINTENTEPVLKAEKFAFTTNGTYGQVSKAVVYYTAAANEFKTSTKVGEAEIAADAFEVTATSPVSLIEGDNYFWLAYTINDEALNGQKVDATIVSATLNGTANTVSGGNPDGERVVENIVFSYKDMVTSTKKVNGSLSFKSKPYSTSPSKYEYGTDDRTNIFVPLHSGKVIQIDFSSFDVYYSSSTYGQRADFKVYSGQGTSGELLWSIDDQKGPGKVLRSTAADGSMTIVFNPKATTSTYCAGGWEATVSEYESQPMAIDSIVATQTSTDDVRVGATNEPIIGFNIVTTGDLTKLNLNSVTLDLKNTQKNISKVYVYAVEKDTEPTSTDSPVGTASVDACNSELTVNISPALELTEGKNYFRVLLDVSDEATVDETIDVAVKSVKTGDTTTNAVNGDPAGVRTIKNIFNIQSGSNGEIIVSKDAPLMFYDDGGASGDGADGVEATVTFVPKETGNTIKLIDKGITFAATAHLYIYEGGEVNDDKLIADVSGSSAKFDPIISNAADGKITVKYIGKGSYTRPNFAIEVQSYQKKAFEIKNYTVSDVSTTNVMAGQEEVQMLRVDMTVEGDFNPLEVQQFNIEALQNAAIEKVFVYATDTVAAFSAANKFGEAQGSTNVTGSYSISKEGVYKFWIAYNIKSDAAVGAQASAKLTSFTINGTQTSVTDDITATITVKAGMHGTFTVGTGGDYPTIQAAVDAISSGVDGPVVINIKNGEYNEAVNVPHIPGASGVNTITLQSESGNYSDVKIYHNSYSYPFGAPDQERKKGVITISGCDWFTLKNVEITTTDNTYPGVVQLKNESRHVTIEGCYLHAAISTSAQQSIGIVNMTAIDESNRNNDYITVRNNLIEGGYIGMRIGGTGYVRLPKEIGAVIEGNTIKNSGAKSIYVMDELGAKIRNNTVIIEADAETKISVGVFDFQLRDEYNEPVEVTGNIFNVAPKTYAAVFNLRQVEATPEAPMLIANNVINLASLNASYSALKLVGAQVKNLNIAHNTIRMTGTNGGAAFWAASTLTSGYGNINVVNNIVQNETSGYAANLYNDGNLGTEKINFENNVLFSAGSTFFRAASSTNGDFDTFVAKTSATGNVNKKVNFLSDDVLEPSDNLEGDLLTAKALSYVTTDITGKSRPAANITIGAYEYSADNEAPVMLNEYPKVLTAIDGKATFAVKTDLAATVYCIVKKASEAAPTKDELKASDNKKDVTANTEATMEAEGLETGEQYIAYFLPIGLRGAEGAVSQTETFTMTATPPVTDKPEAEVYINNSTTEDTVEAGQSVTLMAMVLVDSRTAPYTLTWMDSKHNVLLTETYDSEDDIDDLFMVTATPTECTDYIFIVKDNAEKADTAVVRAIVTGEAVTATFENLYLDSESHWHNADNRNSFVSGSYKFDSNSMPAWNFYYDFAYTNKTSTTYASLADQYNSAVGSGVDGSENYVVAYPQGGKITVMNNAEGDSIRGFYITNTAWTVDAVHNGDGMSGAFAQNDWFKVTVRGDNGNSVDFYLADYRAANAVDHYCIDTWQWVDLTSLGKVKTVSFSFDGTKKNTYGLTTPTYFCLDNFNGERNETTTTAQTATDGLLTLDVNDFTSLDEAGATKTFEIVEAPDGINVSINADGTLTATGDVDGTFDIVVKVTQKGKTEYIRIPVTIVTGIRTINGIDIQEVEGYYTIDGKRVERPIQGVNILRMKNGTTRKVVVK